MSVSFTNLVTPTNYPANTRILEDAGLAAEIALPAAAGYANTAGIDLKNITPFPTTETINVYVVWAASANAGNGYYLLQDCATDTAASYTNISTLAPQLVTVATTANVATFKLPPNTKRYIRAQCKTGANSANLADAAMSVTLLF
jgi:hypothetical protein